MNLEDAPMNDIYLTREEAEQQENGAYVTVLYHSIFFSLSFNYLYQTFLQEIITDGCELIIKFFDQFQIEVHFLRYLYLAIFDTRSKILLE